MGKPYEDRTQDTGSASVKTLYLKKVPNGFNLLVHQVSAYIYTTVMGDYTTAKYVNVGFERNGVKFYLKGQDVATSDTVIHTRNHFIISSGCRPFATFEDTATTVTYFLEVVGELVPIETI